MEGSDLSELHRVCGVNMDVFLNCRSEGDEYADGCALTSMGWAAEEATVEEEDSMVAGFGRWDEDLQWALCCSCSCTCRGIMKSKIKHLSTTKCFIQSFSDEIDHDGGFLAKIRQGKTRKRGVGSFLEVAD